MGKELKMSRVIGLFWNESDADHSIINLKAGGFSEEKIGIINTNRAIRELFDCCKPLGIVGKYAAWGAFFGILTYAVFALVAGWCQCTILNYGHGFAIGTLLAGVLVGTIVGGVMGCFVGWAESDKDVHFYLQGMRLGGKVLSVQADESEIEKAKDLLLRENAHEVKVIASQEK
jgi:hypothetical protein